MSDEYSDLNADDDGGTSEASGAPAPNRGNRTFGLAAGILGGVFLLALILMGLFALVILPRQREARETQIVEINANNTVTAQALTQQVGGQAQTVIAKGPTNTALVLATQPVATNTPVIAVASPTPQFDPTEVAARSTATVAALLTQVARSQLTLTPQAPAALPTATPLVTQVAQEQPTSIPLPTATRQSLQVQPTSTPLSTQVAQLQPTRTPRPTQTARSSPTPQARLTSTALPATGFADEVGLPGLLGMALVLMAIIFIVRRLRSASI